MTLYQFIYGPCEVILLCLGAVSKSENSLNRPNESPLLNILSAFWHQLKIYRYKVQIAIHV